MLPDPGNLALWLRHHLYQGLPSILYCTNGMQEAGYLNLGDPKIKRILLQIVGRSSGQGVSKFSA